MGRPQMNIFCRSWTLYVTSVTNVGGAAVISELFLEILGALYGVGHLVTATFVQPK